MSEGERPWVSWMWKQR